MSLTDQDPRLDALLSREEIRNVLARQARGVDRADEALLKSCYHEDAIEEHGPNYSGPAHAYIEGAVQRIRQMGSMAHYLCNQHIELDGDTAWVEAYVITFARFQRDGEDVDTFTGARSVDRFERRNGEWKIAHRKLVFDWNRDTPANQTWCLGMFDPEDPNMHHASKDEADLSYQRF
jgi:ketosteroid isomerase-like protein